MPRTVVPGEYLYSRPPLASVPAPARCFEAEPAITVDLPSQPPCGREPVPLSRDQFRSADNELLPHPSPGILAPNIRQRECFAAPEGIDAWMRDNLENPSSPSPESYTEQQIPPQDPGTFFDEAWQGLALHPEYQDASPDPFQPSRIPSRRPITPLGMPAPRTSYVHETIGSCSIGRPGTDPDPINEVAAWATYAYDAEPQAEPKRSACTKIDCPMAAFYHLEGIYVHNDNPRREHSGVFGESNPPPFIYQAIQRGCQWTGTQDDADLVPRFIAYHGVGGNRLLAPHTNFLWGDEVNTPQAVPGAPVVRLPFPAIPLRIHFDATLNLPDPLDAPGGPAHASNGHVLGRCIDPSCQVVRDYSVH
ncbi:MAG: hypothetical protein Q9173_003866 [Seirophora scorigena]